VTTEVFFTYLILWLVLLYLGFFFSRDEKIYQQFNEVIGTS
jgi:hypothetical protein